MKSPWKFLSDLTSRRRPSGPPDLLIGHDGDRKPIEDAVQPALLQEVTTAADDKDGPASETKTATAEPDLGSAATAASPVNAEVAQREAVDGARSSDAREHSRLSERKPITRSKKATPNKPRRGLAVDTTAESDHQPAQPLPAGKPISDETISLDDEIKQLRQQLAQKLQLQNAQLRDMLARFDRG